MKKTILAFMASLMLGSSTLYAAATSIEVYAVATSGPQYHTCEKTGQWDYVQNPANVTYYPESGYYVTNSCHGGGEGYMVVIVWGTNITKMPVVGLAGDLDFIESASGTYNGKPYKQFLYYQDNPTGGDVNGPAKAFYSEGYGVLSSMDRFLRNP